MPNLLYKTYQTGCYISWLVSAGDYEPEDYDYGYSSNIASYYADLKPNTTYTIQRLDNSTRFRIGLSSQNLKILTASSGTSVVKPFEWAYRADSSDSITFTTTATATHLVVYYTNNSEYNTRVMLNEGSTIQPYEPPTKLWGWIMQGNRPFETDSIATPSEPFVGDSPYTFWRIDPNANNGRPYQGLMIGVPVLASKTVPNSYYGNDKLPAMYYGDIPIYKAYYGDTQIEN